MQLTTFFDGRGAGSGPAGRPRQALPSGPARRCDSQFELDSPPVPLPAVLAQPVGMAPVEITLLGRRVPLLVL